jgi:hypothetical protein
MNERASFAFGNTSTPPLNHDDDPKLACSLDMDASYRLMALDEQAEAEAAEWANALIGDVAIDAD